MALQLQSPSYQKQVSEFYQKLPKNLGPDYMISYLTTQ